MKIRLPSWVSKFVSVDQPKPSNRYEGGQRFTGGKSWIPAYVQDARFDANSADRWEMLRKARYWERNSAFVNRLADTFEQYTVGTGLRVQPKSSDPDWNRRAKIAHKSWSKFPDMQSRQPFSMFQGLIARLWFIDGEVFVLKTQGKSGRVRLQIIESHRIQTPSAQRELEGVTIFDGVQVDGDGRPVGYWVLNGPTNQEFRFYTTDQILHVYEPSRAAMYRGITFLHPILNDTHDLEDLQLLENQAAREAASITNVLTNGTGEFDADTMRKRRFSDEPTSDTQGVDTVQERMAFLKTVLGARAIALKNGEDLKQFRSDRPGVAQREYWDYLVSKICIGVGIPKMLVLPYSIQGTVARADLDIAADFFRSRFGVMADFVEEVWIWQMSVERLINRDVADPPADWTSIAIRPPKSVNVDVGRNSAAILSELEAGIRTWEMICGRDGEDYEDVLEQKAREAAFVDSLAQKYGVAPERISTIGLVTTSGQMTSGDGSGNQQDQSQGQPKEPAAA